MTVDHPDKGRGPLQRGQVRVQCEPVGKVDILGPSFGGDPYGLSLVVEVVAAAAGWLWRIVVGRGRWRVVVTDRGSDSVVFSRVYKSKRAAANEGMAKVETLFNP